MSVDWKQNISKEIFYNKYMINGEKSEDDVFKGIAEEIASAEKIPELQKEYALKFYKLFDQGKFMSGGRIVANARPDSKLKNYNNCFTIDIEDSMEGIFDSLKEDALISKVGGGVGFDISKIRPKADVLSTGGESSGPISFLKIFDASAKTIMTGGARRSAHIALMRVDHPDIEEFITCKQGDSNKVLTQFNISVKITDKFIKAVENDKDWNLVFNGKTYKTVKAKYLYDLIAKNAYEHNEPGIFNVDTVNKYNNGYWAFDMNCVNPCFTGDTLVAVADGRNAVSIKKLAEENKDVPIYAKNKNGKTIIKMMRNIKKTRKNTQLVKITLDDSSTIKCTPNHKIMLRDGSYKEAKDLVNGESLKPFNSYTSNKNYRQIQSGTKRDRRQYRMIAEFNNIVVDAKSTAIHHNDFNSLNDHISNLIPMPHKEHIKLHSNRIKGKNNPYYKMSKESKFKFASHPGKRNGRYSGYTDDQLFNIMIDWIKEHNYPMSTSDWGKLSKQKKYPQMFTSFRKPLKKMLKEANELCGFKYHDNKYTQREYRKKMMLIAMYNHKVTSVEYIHSEDVYDGTVDDVHNFGIITSYKDDNFIESSGVFVHNCGEICMPIYSLCCLGSVNFSKFVVDPFTKDAYFDFDELKSIIKTAVRFLDNVLDICDYPLLKIKETSLNWRRIGLGFTGFGDMLAKLNIKYGDDESKRFTKNLAELFRNYSYEASIDLAKEKGTFPKCDNKKLVKSEFIQKLPMQLQKDIKKYGLRNVGINTCAPTGTTSLTLGQNCSSGIEPIFSLQYDRNIRTGRGDETVKETIYDAAWLEYREIKINEFIEKENPKEIDFEKLVQELAIEPPEQFVTTVDIDPKDAIDIQAIWQDDIDHSISKTLNLPPGTTFEEYQDLFMYAYKKELKGFTTFNPEGSMKGILEYNKPKETKYEERPEYIERINAPVRPKELPCDVHIVTVKGTKYIVLVGNLHGTLYEVFVDNHSEVIGGYKKGVIKKKGKSSYDLYCDGNLIVKDLSNSFDSVLGTLARMVSMALRHGTPLQFVVDQLSKSKEFVSFEKVVMRVLKKYIKDGEKVLTSDVCGDCGGEMIYQGGCVQCKDCGWSKCG